VSLSSDDPKGLKRGEEGGRRERKGNEDEADDVGAERVGEGGGGGASLLHLPREEEGKLLSSFTALIRKIQVEEDGVLKGNTLRRDGEERGGGRCRDGNRLKHRVEDRIGESGRRSSEAKG